MGWRFLNSRRSTFFLRYTDLDSVIEDVVRLSRQRLESVERRLRAEEEEVSDTNKECTSAEINRWREISVNTAPAECGAAWAV